MPTITDKTKGLIVIGENLYKLSAKDLKTLTDIINNSGGSYYIGNKIVWTYDSSEFLDLIEKTYKPIGTLFGIY